MGQCWGLGGAGKEVGPCEPGGLSLMDPNVQGLGDAPSTDWCGPTVPELESLWGRARGLWVPESEGLLRQDKALLRVA